MSGFPVSEFSKFNVKDLVKDNKKVHFSFYRAGELWYEHEDGLLFPVPISDVGDATFLKTDRAMLFMRYIRKHIDAVGKEIMKNLDEEATKEINKEIVKQVMETK